ncbi:MAG: MSMEG_1061 family FMN-dependent PPOX-type flavoprotein [Acidimicrobiales bacterium]
MTTSPTVPFAGTLTRPEQLREHYRQPGELVKAKKIDHLDANCRAFIAACPFVLLATSGADGGCDVSPRGGPAGFVRVLDEARLAIPDLNGNNLLDSLTNVVENPHVGLLFVLPGRDETLRVNGRAWISVDDELLAGFADLRRPKAAIAVEVTSAFIHCAKSFRRGGVWAPESWAPDGAPSAAELLVGHCELDQSPDELAALLEAGYEKGLALDRPE